MQHYKNDAEFGRKSGLKWSNHISFAAPLYPFFVDSENDLETAFWLSWSLKSVSAII